jgi:twitching motility two-component system response regulator PilH
MLKVFIGEDDPTQAMYLTRVLSRVPGVESQVFGDGLGLYQAVQESPPDLIIMDNVLPKLDGMAAARLIKYHEKTQGIPFLLVSAIDSDQLDGFGECGADAFLHKPLKPSELAVVMERFFGSVEETLH